MMKQYPTWVCQYCGYKASKGEQRTLSTWHINTCNVCNEQKEVTEPRDFNYPNFKGSEPQSRSYGIELLEKLFYD